MSFLLSFILAATLSFSKEEKLLTDPILESPTDSSVRVVWFTEFPGEDSFVEYGEGLGYVTAATTQKLSRMREDTEDGKNKPRDIWRHEAVLEGLEPASIPYRVTSVNSQDKELKSEIFSCSPLPAAGAPLKILLTSDHQLKPMVAANMQKAKETAKKIDAVFFAGDLVNHPDKASEWFDTATENAFFPVLQGRASKTLAGKIYEGAKILQFAPLYSAIGNHEVMGRYSNETSLNAQSNDPYPRAALKNAYEKLSSKSESEKDEWIKNNSFNTDSYEEIFSLPESKSGGKKYYATTFGDVRLVVLDIARIWRSPELDKKGKYSESKQDLQDNSKWGYGEFIFESIEKGSTQYQWLEEELQSEDFQKAKYKIVMFHHPMHSLGDNVVPPFTDPEQKITRDADGKITSVSYEYPKEKDFLIKDIEPLLIQYGVQLVFYGHNHIWNRFQSPSGLQFLESSNVGNTNGGYLNQGKRTTVLSREENGNYVEAGDPNGLQAIMPTLKPLKDENGQPLPYIASNEITVFSILDTGSGAIDSYYFDTTKPESSVVHFDRFFLKS